MNLSSGRTEVAWGLPQIQIIKNFVTTTLETEFLDLELLLHRNKSSPVAKDQMYLSERQGSLCDKGGGERAWSQVSASLTMPLS